MRTLVMGDIHGHLSKFIELLDKVNYVPGKDRLVLLGDYVDRGPDSKGVLDKLIELAQYDNVHALKGNHEDLMEDAIFFGYDIDWINNGGMSTLYSYLDEKLETFGFNDYLSMKKNFQDNYKEHMAFIKKLPLYFEDEEHIFVHAGIHPDYAKAWQYQPTRHFMWVRERFYQSSNLTGKTIVFGHTPVRYIHGSDDIWFRHDKIGVDGGCFSGGQLNCLIIDGQYSSVSV